MKKIIVSALLLTLCMVEGFSQDSLSKKESGKLQLGLRSVVSAFSDDGANGMGVGGQFRLKFGSRLNSDWFFDYITTDIGGLAKRTDYHIGWSVLYYPFNSQIKKGKLTPYLLAGHCFDYTKVQKNNFASTTTLGQAHRLSSAVQSGLGTHYNLADNFDISLTAQYMIHLGNDIHSTVFDNEVTGQKDVLIEEGDLGLEGHLLINLSLNVYIADLWSRK
jgi:hypothetical protein